MSDGRLRPCPRVGGRRGKGQGWYGSSRLRVGFWNIVTLTWKSIELVKIFQKRRINIACVQNTRWVGSKAQNVDGYKIWYSGSVRGKSGVSTFLDRELKELVRGDSTQFET